MSLDFKLKRTLRGVGDAPRMWLPLWMSPLAPTELQQLFDEPVDAEEIFSEAIVAWERSAGANDIDRSICFYIDLYLQDDILTKVDRASMMHSLEVRAPFLDIELVDFLRTLPADLKLRGGVGKWLLKRAARPLLPEGVVDRRKQGFAVPTGRWFEQGLVPVDANDGAFWHARLGEHRAGKADHRLYLWSQLVLDSHRGTRPPGEHIG